MLSRRKLLLLGAASSTLSTLTIGRAVVGWWDRPPGAEYEVLDPDEAAFLRALADAAFPPVSSLARGGADCSLDHFFDQCCSVLPETPRNQLRMLLHLMDNLPRTSTLSTFTDLERTERQVVLDGWLGNSLAEIRAAAASLVVLLGMGFTTHPDNSPTFSAWYGCGYGR